jgi:hypothetical protein
VEHALAVALDLVVLVVDLVAPALAVELEIHHQHHHHKEILEDLLPMPPAAVVVVVEAELLLLAILVQVHQLVEMEQHLLSPDLQ